MQDDQSRNFNKNRQDKTHIKYKSNSIQQSGQIRHNQFKEAANSSVSFVSAAVGGAKLSREVKNNVNNNNHL